jgi:hypothetical protein
MNGTWRDKMHTLTSLSVFAAQHHMHWVNLGLGARRPTSTPARIRCIPLMSGRAIISAGGWRR